MPTAEARVETERSSRYLVQLCRHLDEVSRSHPQMRAEVEWSDDRGVISLGWGRCLLRADPGVLIMRAEAPDPDSLHQLEQRIAERLELIGWRDGLAVAWTPSRDTDASGPERTPA